ncbi:MAG: excisionase family DNA-binding protein [bacterium]|nr:excisionase family DNA-binding protein [bacterium]
MGLCTPREMAMMTTQTETTPTKLVHTVKEAADALCIGYSTARERIRCGELRSFKDGSRRLVAGEDLLTYIRLC